MIKLLLLPTLIICLFAETKELQKEYFMSVNGTFEIQLTPQEDSDAPAGRMVIKKEYSGGMSGQGVGQMLSKRTSAGTAAYTAVEEFTGSIEGRNGSFTLVHVGFMSAETQALDIKILEGSGTDELVGITGTLLIIQEDGKHNYELTYQLN